MTGSLLAAARQPRRRPGRAAAPLQWLVKHPLSTAVLYMLIGGAIMYLLLAGSSNQQLQPQQQHLQQQQNKPAVLPSRAPAINQSAQRAAESAVSPPTKQTVCTDTCFKSKDGVCDDGRRAANMSKGLAATVLCDLGTDCSDCGVWDGVQNSSSWTEPIGPVQYLRKANLPILVKQSIWDPKFHFAYANASRDGEPNRLSHEMGFRESTVTQITYQILREACKKDNKLMVDVGAGFGWYSILAGVVGCRVVAFEPITLSRAFMEYSIARNKLQDKVRLRPTVVVQHPSKAGNRKYTVAVPQHELWGPSWTDGKAEKHRLSGQGIQKVTVSGETLDQVLLAEQLKHVALLKVDAKGHEADVIAGASQLLQKQLIDNILMGYSPHMLQQHAKRPAQVDRAPKMLLSLLSSGFNIGHIRTQDFGDKLFKSLSDPLEMLPAVTETNLKFDLSDSMQLTSNGTTWFKAPCREMLDLQLIGDKVPERLHPRSFGSSFDINTNVWASRTPRFLPFLQGPAVGAFPVERKVTDSWFIPEWSDAAMGGRSCRSLQKLAARKNLSAAARASYLIRHRCRCGRLQPCEEEESIADKCAQEGKTPFSDDPS